MMDDDVDIPIETMLSLYELDRDRAMPEVPKCPLQNPFWVKCMNDAKWLRIPEGQLIGKGHPKYESNILRLREPGGFGGLINRGNICYANASLQAWFHNPIIRRGILAAKIDPNMDADGIFQALQNLFAHLKFSQFKEVDPKKLYEALKINNDDQHDALEFAMQLSNKLGELDVNMKTIFEENLFGKLRYERKCKKCGAGVLNTEQYMIVTLAPDENLQQALGEKLCTEELEGYFCNNCQEPTGAESVLEFASFPPVLQFQINRNSYNPRTKQHTKIRRSFTYPDEYDFQQFVAPGAGPDNIYSAFAALIHYGTTATRGHYEMKIRNHQTGMWHHFSDTQLRETEAEEDGMNECNNVCFVMYVKKSVLEAFPSDDITSCGDSEIQLNTMVDEEDRARVILKDEQHASFIEMHALVVEMVNGSKEGDILDFQFFSNKWLKDLLRSIDYGIPDELLPVDNTDILCRHDKVATPKFNAGPPYRVFPPELSAKLLTKLTGGPQLIVKDMMCEVCIRNFQKRHPDEAELPAPEGMDVEEISKIGEEDSSENFLMVVDGAGELLPPPSPVSKSGSNTAYKISCSLEKVPSDRKFLKTEQSIGVHGTQTLLHLKSLMARLINADPTSISVSFKNSKLTNDEMTLAEYGIGPGDIVNYSLSK